LALVRTYVSEELSVSIIRVARIDELGTTLAVSSNRRTLRRNIFFTSENADRSLIQTDFATAFIVVRNVGRVVPGALSLVEKLCEVGWILYLSISQQIS
jgi:hypothetical protein